jgi:hypothetical protein
MHGFDRFDDFYRLIIKFPAVSVWNEVKFPSPHQIRGAKLIIVAWV